MIFIKYKIFYLSFLCSVVMTHLSYAQSFSRSQSNANQNTEGSTQGKQYQNTHGKSKSGPFDAEKNKLNLDSEIQRIMKSSNPYEILGLEQNASLDDIKKRYKNLSHRYHPDRNPDVGREVFQKIQNAYEQLKNPSLRSSFSESTQAYQAKWNTNNLGDLSFEDQLMQRTDYSSFFDKIFKHEDFLKFLQLHLSSNYFFRLKTIFQDMDNPALFMYVATASPFLLWSSDNIFINSLGFISPILVASAPFLKKSDIEEMQRFQILLYLRLRQMLIFENKLNFSLLMVDYFDLLVASLESLIQNIKQSNKAEYFNDEAEFKIAFIQSFFKNLLPELTSQNQSLNIYNAFILRSFFKKSFHHISASEREQVFVSNASFWLPHFYNIMSKKELYDLIKNSSEFDTVFFKMKNATNKSLFTRVKNYKNQTCNALFFLNRHNKF